MESRKIVIGVYLFILSIVLIAATWRSNLIRAGMDSDGSNIWISGNNKFIIGSASTFTMGLAQIRREQHLSKIVSTSPYLVSTGTRYEQVLVTTGSGVIDLKLPSAPSTPEATYSSGSIVTWYRIVNSGSAVVHLEPAPGKLCLGKATSAFTSASVPAGGIVQVESFPDTKRTPMRWLVTVSTGTLALTYP